MRKLMGIKQVSMPAFKLKNAILKVLKEEGYIEDFEVVDTDDKKDIQCYA